MLHCFTHSNNTVNEIFMVYANEAAITQFAIDLGSSEPVI